LIQHNNEIKIEWIDILTAEKYYLIYTAIVSTMLWGLDKLQIRIKQFSFRLLFDFILTIVIFWGAYQLLFIVTHLDYVRVDMFRWQWIYIPLVVAIYRIYNLYNQRKIDQLLQEKELEISKQKELTTKAELLALQSRINPHFLYNSLNSIASLTTIDAHKAEQMSVNLAKLFRYNLNKTDDLMTTIECELEMVKLYLNIEKQRFGDRLVYLVDVPSELMTFQIPIFLLQPLVENAIKHGLSKITEQGVLKIKISMSENQLIIKVYDNGPLFTNDLIFGYGLQNIFDKLTLVYKNNYTVRFVNESDKHIEIGITEVRIMNTEVRIQN
jgi:sensor histidine kinase YesM